MKKKNYTRRIIKRIYFRTKTKKQSRQTPKEREKKKKKSNGAKWQKVRRVEQTKQINSSETRLSQVEIAPEYSRGSRMVVAVRKLASAEASVVK